MQDKQGPGIWVVVFDLLQHELYLLGAKAPLGEILTKEGDIGTIDDDIIGSCGWWGWGW